MFLISVLLSITLISTAKEWNPGHVYVYTIRWPSLFQKEAELESPVGNNSFFGTSVAIHDNAIAVGAEGFRKFYARILMSYSSRVYVILM